MDNKGKLFIEKRKHKRSLKKYDVRYKLMPKEMTAQQSKLGGISIDISMGGVRIDGEVVGQEGDVLRLEIDTGRPEGAIVVFAEIRWIKKGKDKKGELGLQFLALREEDLDTITSVVSGD